METELKEKESRRINRLAAILNMIPNLVWTGLFLLPVALYGYALMDHKTFYILLGFCLIPIFFPNSFFDAIQLSRNPVVYQRIGVKYINKFAQNGTIINQYLRKKHPGFKPLPTRLSSVKKRYYQTYFFEKFHFSLFLFFVALTIHTLINGYFFQACIISVCNLLYNIYPNLLQQYIRLKLASAIIR